MGVIRHTIEPVKWNFSGVGNLLVSEVRDFKRGLFFKKKKNNLGASDEDWSQQMAEEAQRHRFTWLPASGSVSAEPRIRSPSSRAGGEGRGGKTPSALQLPNGKAAQLDLPCEMQTRWLLVFGDGNH